MISSCSHPTLLRAGKIHMLREFDPQGGKSASVPDPYYGDIADFEEVYEIIQRSGQGSLRFLEQVVGGGVAESLAEHQFGYRSNISESKIAGIIRLPIPGDIFACGLVLRVLAAGTLRRTTQRNASTSKSTSSRVLYRPKEMRIRPGMSERSPASIRCLTVSDS